MARSIPLEQYLGALDPDRRAQVQALRAIVREAGPALEEGMKWKAPNWALGGVDRITVNTTSRDGRVRLVLHMGVALAEDRSSPPVMDDPGGLVDWSSNIRGVITFGGLDDLEGKAPVLRSVLERWLALPVHPGAA